MMLGAIKQRKAVNNQHLLKITDGNTIKCFANKAVKCFQEKEKKEKDCHEELFSDFSKQNRNMSLAKAVTLSQPLYMGYFYCENR